MKTEIWVIEILVVLVVVAGAYFFLTTRPESVLISAEDMFADVQIQPKDAIALAKEYLEEHGTTKLQDDVPFEVVIVRKGDWYGVMNTNYPAKTFEYYFTHGVKVHVNSGEVTFEK